MVESVIIGIVTVTGLVWLLTAVLGGISGRKVSRPGERTPMKRAA